MGVGIAIRLAWFSGLGLGDDNLLKFHVDVLLNDGVVWPHLNAYRFTWWIPTAVSCRLLGVGEAGLLVPVVLFDALGMLLLYAFGKFLWGTSGAVIATLLLLVHPLDFAWSTMLTHDILLSFFSGLAILLILKALHEEETARKRRDWMLAALCLWLGFHTKISVVLLGPGIVLIGLLYRRRLDRHALVFVWTGLLLFGGTVLVSYVFTGDPIAPYTSEIEYQGLAQANSVEFHRLTSSVFWSYPRWLFWRSDLGDFVHSLYPHLLVTLFALSPFLGLRTSAAVAAWLAAVFLGMQFNVRIWEGTWISPFRNIRHSHVFVYPIILLLTGYLVALWRRHPRVLVVLLAPLLLFSARESIRTADRTRPVFANLRSATAFMAELPPKPVFTDKLFLDRLWLAGLHWLGGELQPSADLRRRQFAEAGSSYAVTGGPRDPYYGCFHCIGRAEELGERWTLLREWPLPEDAPPWWPEPLRVWER